MSSAEEGMDLLIELGVSFLEKYTWYVLLRTTDDQDWI
jgi:hypothetical protein